MFLASSDIWMPKRTQHQSNGKRLPHSSKRVSLGNDCHACQKGQANSEDSFTVEVKKGELIVVHVPRNMSALCSIFLG